jgi:hypothetical protein
MTIVLWLRRVGARGVGLALRAISPASAAIRVGYLGPLTGVFAQAGKDMLDGLKMAFDQAGYDIVKVERVGGAPPEHDRPHVPHGLAVLDVQGRGVLEDARL